MTTTADNNKPTALNVQTNEDRSSWAIIALQWTIVLCILGVSGVFLLDAILDQRYINNIGRSEFWDKRRAVDGREYFWAKGQRERNMGGAEWFDMTDSPLILEDINHGLGKDTIPSIDSPVFVEPDDPALKLRWGRRKDADIGRLEVIGYVNNGEAKAYPIKLLNHHELVNDTVGGKPVTVGW